MKFKVALSTVAALIASVLLGAVAPASAVSTSTASNTTLSTFETYGIYDPFDQNSTGDPFYRWGNTGWWDYKDGSDMQHTTKVSPKLNATTTAYSQYSDKEELILAVGATDAGSRVTSVKIDGVDYNQYMEDLYYDDCYTSEYNAITDNYDCTSTATTWDEDSDGNYVADRTDNDVTYPMPAGVNKLFIEVAYQQKSTVEVTVKDNNGVGPGVTTYSLNVFHQIAPDVQIESVSPNSGAANGGDHVVISFSGLPSANSYEVDDPYYIWRETECYIDDIYFGTDEESPNGTNNWFDRWVDPVTGLTKMIVEVDNSYIYDDANSLDIYSEPRMSTVRASVECDRDYERSLSPAQSPGNGSTYWDNEESGYYGDNSYYYTEEVNWTELTDAYEFKQAVVESAVVPDVFTGGSVVELNGVGMNEGAYDDGKIQARLYDAEAEYEIYLSSWNYTGNENLKLYLDQSAEYMNGYNGTDLKFQVIDCPYSCEDETPLYEKSVTWKEPVPTDVTISPAFDSLAGGKSIKVKGKYLLSYYYYPDLDFGAGVMTNGDENWASYDWSLQNTKGYSVDEDCNSFETCSAGTDVWYFEVPEGQTAGKTPVAVCNDHGCAIARTKFIYGDKPEIAAVSPSSVAITGGSTITLTGKNFGLSGTPTVTIGGEKSPFVIRVSATKVTAVVPAHAAGDVDVNILNPNGGGGNATPAKLKYVAAGTAPAITSVTPATSILAGGGEATIKGTGFGTAGTMGVLVGGKHAKVTASSATSITFEVPEGDETGAVNVIVNSTAGTKTKAAALTYVYPAGITSISPSLVSSYSADADSNVNRVLSIAGHGFGTSGVIKFGDGATCTTDGTYCVAYSGSNGTSIASAKLNLNTIDAGSVTVTVYPGVAAAAVTSATKGLAGAVTVEGPEITNVGVQGDIYSEWNDDQLIGDFTQNPDVEVGSRVGNVVDAWSVGGAKLKVAGTGFGATAGTLKVGTTTVTPTLWSDTTIEFTLPAIAAGDYSVTVQPVHGLAKAIRNVAVHVVASELPPTVSEVVGENGDNYFYHEDADFSDLFTVTGDHFLGTDNGASTVVAVIGYSESDDGVNCGDTFDKFTGCGANYDYAYEVTPASFTDNEMTIKAPRKIGTTYSRIIAELYVKTNVGTFVFENGIYYPTKYSAPAPTVQMSSNAATAGQDNGYGICVYPTSAQGTSLALASGGYTTAPTFTFSSSNASTWATLSNSIHPIVKMSDGVDEKTLTVTDANGNTNTSFTADIPNNWTAWTNPWGAKKLTVSNIVDANGVLTTREFNFTCKVRPVVSSTVGAVSTVGSADSASTHTQSAESMASSAPTLNYAKTSGWLTGDDFVPAAGTGGYEFANSYMYQGSGRWFTGLPDSVNASPNTFYWVRVAPSKAAYDTEKYMTPLVGRVKVALTGSSVTVNAVRNVDAAQVYHGKNYGQLDGQGAVSPEFGFTTTPAVSGNSAVTKVVYEYKDSNCDDTYYRVGLPKTVVLSNGTCNGSGDTAVTWDVRVRSIEMTSSGSNYTRFFVVTKGAPVQYQITPRPVGATIAKPIKYYDGNDSIKLEISELQTVPGQAVSGVVEGDTLKLSADSTGTFAAADAGDREVTFSTLTLTPAGLAASYSLVAPASPIPGLIKKSTALLGLSTDKKVIRSVAPTSEANLTLTQKDLFSGRDVSGENGIADVVWTSTTPSKCTVDSATKVVTPVADASGDCIISVTQAASDNFNVSKSALDDSLTTELITIKVVGAAKTPVVVVDDIQMSIVDSEDGVDPSFQPVGLIEDDGTEIVDVVYTITKVGTPSWTVPSNGTQWPVGTYLITASGGSVSGDSEALQAYTSNGSVLSYVAGKLIVTVVPPSIENIEPPQGPEAGGTTVSIEGTNFDGVTSITIGDVVIRAPKFTFVNGSGDEPDVLTFRTPAGYGSADVILKAGNTTAEDSFSYIAPENVSAKITSISPAKGPDEGGTKVTITGTHLELVASIKVGPDTLYPADFKVNSEGTEITFFSPGGSGKDTITLVTDKGADPTSAFSYIADAPADLDLDLALEVGAKLNGAKAELQGGGLLSESAYTLQMFSTVVTIYTGTTDTSGNFRQFVTMPKKACVEGGRHKLVLKGIDPDGKAVTSTQYMALSDECIVLALSKDKPLAKAKFTGFLFNYNSAKLTKKAKRDLKIIAVALTGAKTVTIYGYTQTNLKSAAAKAANKKLGLARSKAVKSYLKKLGVKAKYVTIGRGAVKPVSTKKQKKNRRVVIVAKYLL